MLNKASSNLVELLNRKIKTDQKGFKIKMSEDHLSNLKGYSFYFSSLSKKNGDKLIFRKFLQYSEVIVSQIINDFDTIKNPSKHVEKIQYVFDNYLDLQPCSGYISNNDKDFEIVLKSRRRFGYKTILYKLKCKIPPYTNKVYFGISKNTLLKRLEEHVLAAIGPHGHGIHCHYVNLVKLHRAIRNAFNQENIDFEFEYLCLMSKAKTPEFNKIIKNMIENIILKYFEVDIIEIHKEISTASDREKWYTKNYVNDDGSIGTVKNGLNELVGGSIGQYIDLPIADFAAMITLGLKQKQISKLIKKVYKINVSYETVSERIRDIWGGYNNAQEIYLKPVIEQLIKDENDFYLEDIASVISRDRSNLRKCLKRWYNGRGIRDLKNLQAHGIMDWSNLSPFQENQRPELRGIPLDTWKKWAVQGGVSCRAIGEKLKFSEETIRQTFKSIPEIGGLKSYRENARRSIIKDRLPKGWDPKEIMVKLFKLKPKDNYAVASFYERLFPNFTFKSIIEKGRKGLL